jgi:hypothetical protein
MESTPRWIWRWVSLAGAVFGLIAIGLSLWSLLTPAAPQGADVSASPLSDIASVAAILSAAIALFAIAAAIYVYRQQDTRIQAERKSAKLHELELSWYVGNLNRDRLTAERILHYNKNPDLRDKSFKQLFESDDISNDEYDAVSQVLRIFYLLDSWRGLDYIDEARAIAVFGKSYHWWYWHQIKSRGQDLADDPDWSDLVAYYGWLDPTPPPDTERNP